MANRKEATARAIAESETRHEEKPAAKRRQRRIASLYSSWGGDDALFYFRWAAADVGFRAQSVEPMAETIGKRPSEFWDNDTALQEKLKRDKPEIAAARELLGIKAGAAARPNQGRQARVLTQADRTTDAHLDAARKYRRVAAGMTALAIGHYAVLEKTFLPRRTDGEIEQAFGQLAWLVLGLERVKKSHASASAKAKEPVSLQTWLVGAIKRNDPIVGLARDDAEKAALEALQAYEAATAAPPEIARAQREAGEPRKSREPPERRSVASAFDPPGWRP